MTRTDFGKREALDFAHGPTEIANFRFSGQNETATVQGSRIITIPPLSTWNTGLHWHEEYIESVRVLRGKARITIAGATRDYGTDDGVLTFPKFIIHGFGRADEGLSTNDAEDTVLEEWVDPENGFKAVFFYNVLGALLEAKGKPGVSDLIQLGTTLAYVDEYPDVVPGPFWLKYIATHSVFAIISWFGWCLGYKPWLKEYTPRHLWEVARTRGLNIGKQV